MKKQKANSGQIEPVVIRFFNLINSQFVNFKRGCLDENNMTWEDIEEFFMDSKFMAKQLLTEHAEMKKFTAGFRTAESCNCKGCEIARRLYGLKG